MHTIERISFTVEEYAQQVRERGSGTFQSKETRDAVAKLIGGRKSSIRSQNLHPEYVTDYVGTIQSGFGNCQYNTYFSALYKLDLR